MDKEMKEKPSKESENNSEDEEDYHSGSSSEIDIEFIPADRKRGRKEKGKNGILRNNEDPAITIDFPSSSAGHNRSRKAPERLTLDFSAASGYGKSGNAEKNDMPKKKLYSLKRKRSSDRAPSKNMKSRLKDSFSSFEATFVQEQHLLQRVIDRSGAVDKDALVLSGRCLDHDRSFPPLHSSDQKNGKLSRNLVSHISESGQIDWKEATACNKVALKEYQLYPLQVSLHGPINQTSENSSSSLDSRERRRQFLYLLPQPYSFFRHHYFSYPCEETTLESSGPSNREDEDCANHRHSSVSLFEMPQFLDSHLIGNSLPVKVHFYPRDIPELLGQRCVGYIFSYHRSEDSGYSVIFPHRSDLRVEQKHPFEFEIGVMNEEDAIVVDRLAKTLSALVDS